MKTILFQRTILSNKKTMQYRRFIKIGLLSVAGYFFPLIVSAHPHSWVDMKTYVQGSKDTITGFVQEWTFDPMTTAFMFDGEDMTAAHQKQTLKKVANQIMKNLINGHYYTYFYDHDTPVKYHVAEKGTLTKKGPKATLTFELPLAHPKKVTADSLILRVFEPSYYVDMEWGKASDITLSPDLAKTCSYKLISPNPTPEQISYAMSLPADADPDNTLGQLFTQTVKFRCHPSNTQETVNEQHK